MIKNNTRIINLANIEDINAYNIGEYTSYGNRWINFGKNNDYPSFLRNLYLNSPTHQSICDNVAQLANDKGVTVINPEQNPISNKFINENFSPEVTFKLISDLKIYGYCVIQVYSGNKCLYSPAIKYRSDVKDSNGNINYCWFSGDWDNYNQKNNKPVKLPLYYEGCTEDLSILILQLDKKGFDYYSPVDYAGAINYVNLESEISKYHLSNIRNGLFPSFLITFIGSEFSDEQMDNLETKINQKFGGSGNSGRAIISFAPDKDSATDLKTVDQPNLNEQWQWLSEESANKILVGHGVSSPLLIGMRDTGGGLGNNAGEMESAYAIYQKNKLTGYQNIILNGITKIMNGNLLYAPIKFIVTNPFSSATTEKLSKIEELNEIEQENLISTINVNAVKPNGKIISEKIMTVAKDGCLYKFVKSSNKNNFVIKNFEILDKKGYLFKKFDLIKNTPDYYFVEQIYFKNN